MIRITKVSARKYEVFHHDEKIYTIKRKATNRYIVRPQTTETDEMVIFETLGEAKDFVRCVKYKDDEWLKFFTRYTKGKKFESQEDSNQHMVLLSKRWTTHHFEKECRCGRTSITPLPLE